MKRRTEHKKGNTEQRNTEKSNDKRNTKKRNIDKSDENKRNSAQRVIIPEYKLQYRTYLKRFFMKKVDILNAIISQFQGGG